MKSSGITVVMRNIAGGQRQWHINRKEVAIKMSTIPILEGWGKAIKPNTKGTRLAPLFQLK